MVAELHQSTGNETLEHIRTNGGEAILVPTDVSRELEVKRLMDTVIDQFGRINILHYLIYYTTTQA